MPEDMTTSNLEDDFRGVLLEETWIGPPRGDLPPLVYRLVICRPTPFGDGDFKCAFNVEGLYDKPRYHPQISPALAVRDALSKAIGDLLSIRALPGASPAGATEPNAE